MHDDFSLIPAFKKPLLANVVLHLSILPATAVNTQRETKNDLVLNIVGWLSELSEKRKNIQSELNAYQRRETDFNVQAEHQCRKNCTQVIIL